MDFRHAIFNNTQRSCHDDALQRYNDRLIPHLLIEIHANREGLSLLNDNQGLKDYAEIIGERLVMGQQSSVTVYVANQYAIS